MGDSTVMLSAAKHLDAHRDRPFPIRGVYPERSERLRACPERSEWGDSVGADFIIHSDF
jgi:hypothetical protein